MVWVAIAMATGIVQPAYGQTYSFQKYTVGDGLISNSINVLYQDSRGFMWIGTNDGLSMYDGQKFSNFTTDDGLGANYVSDITEDRTAPGRLWIGTSRGGVNRLENNRVTRFSFRPGGQADNVQCVMCDRGGTIWCGTDDGIFLIDGDAVRRLPDGGRVKHVSSFVEYQDSLVMILHDRTLTAFDTKTSEFRHIEAVSRLPHLEMAALCIGSDGDLWIICSGRKPDATLFRMRGISVVDSVHIRGWGYEFIIDDGDGALWCGSYDGLTKIPKNAIRTGYTSRMTIQNGLSENTVRAALFDREHNLWVGGVRAGIAKLPEDFSLTFSLGNIIDGAHNQCFAMGDDHSHIWVVSDTGLWEVFQSRTGDWRTALHRPDDGKRKNPYSLFCGRDQTLWVVFYDGSVGEYGIRALEGDSSGLGLVREFLPGRDFPGTRGNCLIVDHGGRVWYSVFTVGVVLLDPAKSVPLVRIFNESDGVPTNYVNALCEDQSGAIWCGSYPRGLVRISPDSIGGFRVHSYGQAQGLPDARILTIHRGSDQRVWVGTSGGGVTIIDRGTLTTVTTRSGLPSNTVSSIIEEPTGEVWFATPAGMAYRVGADSFVIRRPRELREFSCGAAGVTGNGMLWFTSGGLVLYDIERTKRFRAPSPPIVITSVAINGEKVTGAEEMQLPHDHNNISIGFVGLSFVNEHAVQYQYRLIEADTSWQAPTSQSSVVYASLRPSTYVFEVKAINARGVESLKPSTLSFTITPPFWERWWFVGLVWMGIAGTVGGIIRVLEKGKMRKRIEVLEREQALERERGRIARDMHDEIGASLTEISILSELAQRDAVAQATSKRHLEEISEKAEELVDSIGAIIWALSPRDDSLQSLIAHLRQHVVGYLAKTPIRCTFVSDDGLPERRLSPEVRRNLYLIVKEAVHNIVKHSGAHEATIVTEINGAMLGVTIEDDGIGFNPEASSGDGNGLANMRRRIEDVGGELSIESAPARGTRIRLTLDLFRHR